MSRLTTYMQGMDYETHVISYKCTAIYCESTGIDYQLAMAACRKTYCAHCAYFKEIPFYAEAKLNLKET
ncbi:hypothetical protein VPHD292_0067 [Vibrio phage D292]